MIRTRTALAVTVAAAITLAACGDDDSSTDTAAPVESTADDEMSDDEMSDDEMSDDEMSDDMDDEMSDDEMSDDEMSDDMDDEMSDDMDDDMSMNDVMSRIIERDDLTVLDDAIHAAGLEDTLHTGGPFTVFAPTDEAFAAYLGDMGMTADDVFADVDALTLLLQAHVVEGTDDAAMVMDMDGQSFTTLAGNDLTVTVDGDAVMVGDATIVEYDIVADNGVIHVIDTVLTPPVG
ncbi:MAG: fasciclin domain-containing protein [Ilumatobacteraceae bacterium]